MSKEELEEKKIVSDDGVSEIEEPDIEGGKVDARKGDKKTPAPKPEGVKEEAEKDDDDVENDEDETVKVSESFLELFDGENISEEFKKKMALVFEAAVNEGVKKKTAGIEESLREEYSAEAKELAESYDAKIDESVDSITEEMSSNIDSYLDYVIERWMEENALAIESGIKVEKANRLIEGMKELFAESYIEIDESEIDVIAALEEETAEANKAATELFEETVALKEELAALKAEKVFDEVCEGLTETQIDRMKTLAEKLDVTDIEDYQADLGVLKETFFNKGKTVLEEVVDDGSIELTETVKPAAVSSDLVSSLAEAFSRKGRENR